MTILSPRLAVLLGAVLMATVLAAPAASAQGNVGDTPGVAGDQAPPRTHHHRHRHHRHRHHPAAASRDGTNQ